MKVFVDTSVLVASMLGKHDSHARAFAVLDRIQNGKDEGFVSAHSLAEAYAVLTKLPVPFRHTPEQAWLSIEQNIIRHFKTQSLTGEDYTNLLREAAVRGIQGGTIYDAVLMASAVKVNVDRLFTLNLKHFQAVAPAEITGILAAP